MDWELALLLGDDEKKSGGLDAWYEPVMELIGKTEEERNERDF